MAAAQKWTGGLKDLSLDCSIAPLWDLASDWAHWERFYPNDDGFQFQSRLIEGENRKPGCLRYAEPALAVWTTERLLAIDNNNYSFTYNMEKNVFLGGLNGYRAQVQFEPTKDGKCKLLFWSWEVEPLEQMSHEDFSNYINHFLSKKLVFGLETAANKEASKAAPVVTPSTQKWTGGLKDLSLDCPVAPLWDLASDWAHWERFYPNDDGFQFQSRLIEGENRKPGCLRYAEPALAVWTTERLLAIDNNNYSFTYNMEKNVFLGGLNGYRAQVQFEPTKDGKCKLLFWSWEVEPLEHMSYEDFSNYINHFLSKKLVFGLETAANKEDTKAAPVVTSSS